MKAKKWIVVGLISLALIVAELVLLFVLVLPGKKKNDALKYLEEGNKTEAEKIFQELSDSAKKSMEDDVKDIVVYKANLLLDGKIEYAAFYKTMEAIESIREFQGKTFDAFKAVNLPRMKQAYEDAVAAYVAKDQNLSDSKMEEIRRLRHCEAEGSDLGVYYKWNGSQQDTYDELVRTTMDGILKEKYEAYQAGNLEYDKMYAYSFIASSGWYSDYTYEISTALTYDKYFSEYFDEAKGYFDQEDYWRALRTINSTREWYGQEEVFKNHWADKFDTLYEETEEKAKTYYPAKAIEAAKNGDTREAEKIISELKEHFGDDYDVTEIEQSLHTDWQRAYVEFMSDWEKNVKSAVIGGVSGGDFFEIEEKDYEKNKPTKVFLMDLDNDKVPEMILSGGDRLYIFTYLDSKVKYTGQFPWMGMGDNGTLVAGMTAKEEGIDMSVEALLQYKKGVWNITSVAVRGDSGDQVIYGTGTSGNADDLKEADEEGYNAARKEIEGAIKKTTLTGGAGIKDYEKYINSYK